MVFAKETIREVILTLLDGLDTERHPLQTCNHILRISQCQVTEETLVILVDVIVEECFLTHGFVEHRPAETLEYLLQNGLIEHHALAVEHTLHITLRKQFTTLQDDAVGSGV